MGFSQLWTTGLMQSITMGARKTVRPDGADRGVGDFHISVSCGNSIMRCLLGVMVAHLTATPSLFVAFAASTVT
jgi:hypothetical protein